MKIMVHCYITVFGILLMMMYKENYYFVEQFHSSVLHSNQCSTGCEAHTNFADELACLTADTFGMKWLQLTDLKRC
jgi:hypothetical protein